MGLVAVGLFDDFSRFLESRLEEFLKNNPHLELEALLEQLREQEEDTLRLIGELQFQEKRSQDEILAKAQEIQRWHIRIEKAKTANRLDLAQAAQQREATLLREGNQRWGQMQGVKERVTQAKELLKRIQQRRQEVQTKVTESQATRNTYGASQRLETEGWNQTRTPYGAPDDLDDAFLRWETQDELEQMKRNMINDQATSTRRSCTLHTPCG